MTVYLFVIELLCFQWYFECNIAKSIDSLILFFYDFIQNYIKMNMHLKFEFIFLINLNFLCFN